MGTCPRSPQSTLASRRAEILDGARTAFSKYGYAGATVARLEEATGLSRGAIFHYFGSKRDLFVQLSIEENLRYIDLIVERGLDEARPGDGDADPEWLGILFEIQMQLRHDPEFVRQLDEAHEIATSSSTGCARRRPGASSGRTSTSSTSAGSQASS